MPCPQTREEPFYRCFAETKGWPDLHLTPARRLTAIKAIEMYGFGSAGEDWRIECNGERTHSSLGDITPEEFAAKIAAEPKRSGKFNRRL